MPANSRLHHFALILALSLLPTLTTAQTAAPTRGTVLFDFESGNFDGWTLSGDCWDKQPATPKTFVDKSGRSIVSGIVGNGYLTTFHAKLGNTAMGKAVSKDFPIDKPFLCFKIGRVSDGEEYEFAMSESFSPFRRNVDFMPCEEAPIQTLIEKLAFIPDKKRWGYPLRFGLIEITQPDFEVIAGAMGVVAPG